MELRDIIDQLKANNNSILKKLFEEHADYCISQLLVKTNVNREDANDLFVEAIVNFREKMITGKVTHLTNLRGYLYATCYNMFLVNNERQKRIKRNQKDIEIYFYDYASDTTESDSALLQSLSKGWAKMGKRCKEILTGFYADNMTMTEIAQKFGFANEDVAKSTKGRCLKELKEYVKEFVRY